MPEKWEFLISGDSPEIGAFTQGEQRDNVPAHIVKVYEERGWIKRVPAAPAEQLTSKTKNTAKEG